MCLGGLPCFQPLTVYREPRGVDHHPHGWGESGGRGDHRGVSTATPAHGG